MQAYTLPAKTLDRITDCEQAVQELVEAGG